MPEECVGVVGCQRVDGVLPEGCVAWPVGGGDVRQNASFEDIGRCQGDTSGVEDREDAVRGLVGIGEDLDERDVKDEVLNEVLDAPGDRVSGSISASNIARALSWIRRMEEGVGKLPSTCAVESTTMSNRESMLSPTMNVSKASRSHSRTDRLARSSSPLMRDWGMRRSSPSSSRRRPSVVRWRSKAIRMHRVVRRCCGRR